MLRDPTSSSCLRASVCVLVWLTGDEPTGGCRWGRQVTTWTRERVLEVADIQALDLSGPPAEIAPALSDLDVVEVVTF